MDNLGTIFDLCSEAVLKINFDFMEICDICLDVKLFIFAYFKNGQKLCMGSLYTEH